MLNTLDLNQVKKSFERDGYVKLEQVLNKDEIKVLQQETKGLIDKGWEGQSPAKHFFHKTDDETGEEVFNRIQFLFPKAVAKPNPYLALLGHPVLLSVVEKLLEGYSYVLSGEALVFKLPKNGAAVPIHTDGAKPGPDTKPGHTYFNLDIYLDDATVENGCLLAAPGSHKLDYTVPVVREIGFDFPGLVPVPMKAGDILLHNTRVVHGSHKSHSPKLRRTIYYEFCTTNFVHEYFKQKGFNGIPGRYMDFNAWVEDRAQLIQHAIDLRQTCSYAAGESAYKYPDPEGVDLNNSSEQVDLAPTFGGTHR